jgi:lipoyl(octanoyl) transferase
VEELTTLQRRLVYEVSGQPETARVLFCEHPSALTIGRHGSRLQVRLTDEELIARKLPLLFVPRGGGAMLHTPGQVTCYPILPLARYGVSPGEYVRTLLQLTTTAITASGVPVEANENEVSIRVRGRRVAHLGVGVRNGVSLFGVVVNVVPDLELFRGIAVDDDPLLMTSMQRESSVRVTVSAVQQHLLEGLCDRFSLRRMVMPNRGPITLLHLTRQPFPHRTG